MLKPPALPDDVRMHLPIHDSVLLEVPTALVEETRLVPVAAMESLPAGFMLPGKSVVLFRRDRNHRIGRMGLAVNARDAQHAAGFLGVGQVLRRIKVETAGHLPRDGGGGELAAPIARQDVDEVPISPSGLPVASKSA